MILKYYYLSFFFLISTFLCFTSLTQAQNRYGNEWIDFDKSYVKVQVASDGIYKITYQMLHDLGIPVDTLNPKSFRLFYRGTETAIFIEGSTDSSFDSLDYILFYGEKNDGNADEELYPYKEDMPHQYYALYSDSNSYFLTWTKQDTTGLRYGLFQDTLFKNPVPKNFYKKQKITLLTEMYYNGEPLIIKDDIHKSVYSMGEGWLSSILYKGNSRTFHISLKDLAQGSENIQWDVLLFGKSKSSDTAFINKDDHRINIYTGTYLIADTSFKGFSKIPIQGDIPLYMLDPDSILRIRIHSADIASLNTNSTAIAYIKVVYPARFDFESGNSFSFDYTCTPDDYFEIASYEANSSTPWIFDINNNLIIKGIVQNETIKFQVPALQNKASFHIQKENSFARPHLEKIEFRDFQKDMNHPEFIIISHKKLWPEAINYKNYRNNSGYNTILLDIQQVYDQFYYGLHHPLAIRRCMDYFYQHAIMKPQYLLLLGKGLQNNMVRNAIASDLVPSIGFPPSDHLFTAGLEKNNPLILERNIIPALATGRIAASTADQVAIYLEKLTEMEQSPDSIWKKNIFHVGGGQYYNEQLLIAQSLTSGKQLAEKDPYGAHIKQIFSKSSDPVVYSYTEKIQDNINKGLGMLTYLGHGSLNVLGIDMGEAYQLKNQGRYPLMYMNGCNVGNPNTNFSIGEDFLFTRNKGALAWLGHSTTTNFNDLNEQMMQFYRHAFDTSYGSSVAQIIKKCIQEINPNVLPQREFYNQWILQGDPAFSLFYPQKADFFTEENNIRVSPSHVISSDDSFSLEITVRNAGKAIDTQLFIKVIRIFPDNSIQEEYSFSLPAPFNSDTFRLSMKTGGFIAHGYNDFQIILNPDQDIPELDFQNNISNFRFYIPGSGVVALFPHNYAIISGDSVSFTIQDRNIFNREEKIYEIQVDTHYSFRHPFILKDTSTKSLINKNMALYPGDSTVYYWRSRILSPGQPAEEWEGRSFIRVQGSPTGWSQSRFPQFGKAILTHMESDTNTAMFSFIETSMDMNVSTSIWTHTNLGIKINGELGLNPGVCFNHDLVIIQFDKFSLDHFEETLKCNGEAGVSYRSFDMQNTAYLDSLLEYIDLIPEGNYIALFTRRENSKVYLWPDTIKTALKKLGAGHVFDQIDKDFYNYVLIGKKEEPTGTTIREASVFDDKNDGIDATAEVSATLKGRWNTGTIQSEIIGPAKKWNALIHVFTGKENKNSDQYNLRVYGINHLNQIILLYENIRDHYFSLKGIQADLYPYLKLEVEFRDDTFRTPLQLKRWHVLYDAVPEGTLSGLPGLFDYYADTLMEGDTFRLSLPFTNISDIAFDSLLIETEFSSNQNMIFKEYQRTGVLLAGNSYVMEYSLPTQGYSGKNHIRITFNPNYDQEELVLENNIFSLPFFVKKDELNPVLDVLFDGKHIKNGEHISSSPVIDFLIYDANEILLIDDTNCLRMRLQYPEEEFFRNIYFSNEDISFFPASAQNRMARVRFTPQFTKMGFYKLEVQTYDKSGNVAGNEPWQIVFQIENVFVLHDFCFYPNPFHKNLNLFFYLITDQKPEEMKLIIRSMEGKLVKRILLSDYPIHAGENRLYGVWDGRDGRNNFLPNGLYLYELTMKALHNKAFIKKTGKIQLFR